VEIDIIDTVSKYSALFVIPVLPFVIWWMSKSKENKRYVEKVAQDVKDKAEALAKGLKDLDAKVAEQVRVSIEEFVNSAVDRVALEGKNARTAIQTDVNHKNEMLYAALTNMNTVIADIAKDVIKNDETQRKVTDKLESSNFLLNQGFWGRDTKSDSPLTKDEVESEEHKTKEEEGIFKPTEEEAAERAAGDFSTQEGTE